GDDLAVGGPEVSGADLVVEGEAECMQVERRLVLRARREDGVDAAEPVIEIFRPRAPARRDRAFDAGDDRPAVAGLQELVIVLHDARTLEHARLRPGEAGRAVDQPSVESIAGAAANPRDIVDAVGDLA